MKRTVEVIVMLAVCLAVSCGPGLSTTTTETGACSKLAGEYVSAYANNCGQSSSGDAVSITQAGCTITCEVPGIGTVDGTIEEDEITMKVELKGPCKGTGSGTAKIDGTKIRGSYAGFQTGTNCCTAVAGTFTLARK